MVDKIVVAHRGLCELYPENTLLAIKEAVAVGAKAVEFDVQLSEDHVPVVYHDHSLSRLSDKPGLITEKPWMVLQTYQACYPERFGDKYKGTLINSLAEVADFFKANPGVTACVEIKEESVNAFGVDVVVDKIVDVLRPILSQVLFLSFSAEVIDALHERSLRATCWVLRYYDIESLCRAKTMQPQALAVNQNKLPTIGQALWSKNEGIDFDWMVYHTENPDTVDYLFAQNAKYVETDNIKIIAEKRPEYFKK